jgi:hypothetical protein
LLQSSPPDTTRLNCRRCGQESTWKIGVEFEPLTPKHNWKVRCHCLRRHPGVEGSAVAKFTLALTRQQNFSRYFYDLRWTISDLQVLLTCQRSIPGAFLRSLTQCHRTCVTLSNSDRFHLLSLWLISRLGPCPSNTLSTFPLSLLETAALSLGRTDEAWPAQLSQLHFCSSALHPDLLSDLLSDIPTSPPQRPYCRAPCCPQNLSLVPWTGA